MKVIQCQLSEHPWAHCKQKGLTADSAEVLMEYFLFLCFKSSSRSSRTVLWSTTLHLTTHQHGVFWVNCSFNLNTPSNKEKPSHSPIVSSPIKLFRPPLLVSTWSLLVWPGSDPLYRFWLDYSSLITGFWLLVLVQPEEPGSYVSGWFSGMFLVDCCNPARSYCSRGMSSFCSRWSSFQKMS